MRNFRTAAVASATALTVIAGGTAIASAEEAATTDSKDRQVIFAGKQEGDKSFGEVISDGTKGSADQKGSSHYFDDAKEPFFPTDAFGKKTNAEEVPQWARYWIDGSIVAGIGALVGLIIAGANYAFYNGWLQHPLSK
ncbi:hypothetical protein [Corynebacterium fournieri]|uniref:hypothetical protein n=1 Tax=Corynebacterium fournieri TaxID=1852390 RepID=UPI000A2F0C9B|nr:hypothetical protein [Corynebacterium fournieri]WJY97817.1 hypothetical protein CFOUR_07050 [Corynebacterium fournieri]